ncbi:helix-turn-helix domain-containing protein [uncultured Formosa sp.]|uniref:helix-turn-helix domain-containing protein n=1 Tax=uncultured Formosa sp. TaxID=255435 RepID=UPI00261000F3|nr:helix-turn-helix domain-containing protein [uncultured Formosa sp.]
MTTDKQHITSKRIDVPTDFQSVFSHFYSSKNNTEQTITKTLLPNFQIIMVFSFGAPIHFNTVNNTQINIEKCIVLGPIKQPFDYTLSSGTEMLVANFKDDAFYRLFSQVLVSDQLPINPDAILNQNCFTNLWQFIKNAETNYRVNLILDFCKPYLKDSETAFENFKNHKDNYTIFNPIKIIAQETNQSERTIQLNHKKYFGYTAKEKSRYERFIKVIELLQNQPSKINWFDIIETCGYYDQSQLIHDFKYFTNYSPNQYLKFQQDVCSTK